jgi:Tfp pilus assembly protein PilX
MGSRVGNQRGTALILTVIAMLVMGVLSMSFALLAEMESRVGVAFKHQAQAEALAEAGLERGRDAIRTAISTAGGFTNWLDGTTASHLLAAGQNLNNGQYWVRLDNDCPPAVPTSIREAAACNNNADTNEVAVITAWALSGQGRSRVRAIVGVDNPWKHVCSNAKPDNNGYCNEPGNRNGSPTVSPADPNDPNGPQAYTDLPRPYLGCSRVAPGLHRAPAAAVLVQHALCQSFPQPYAYPYPSGAGVPRVVLTGTLPGPTATLYPKSCNDEPAGGNNNRYFGHFDCALTTYCLPALGDVCGGLPVASAKGCLRGNLWWAQFSGTLAPLWGVTGPDTRVVAGHPNQLAQNPGFARYGEYNPASGSCVETAAPLVAINPGLVFIGDTAFNQDVGSQAKQLDVYVMMNNLGQGNWSQANNRRFFGTLVVEGNVTGGVVFQVGNGAATELWSGPNTTPAGAGWGPGRTYGYPLVAVIYNPTLPPPTISPTYAPQPHYADFGSANTQIHGIIYSGGHVQFNPLSFDGTVVAFEIQTQGSATYDYNTTYGNNTPPSGFPIGGGNQIAIIRKSFVVCADYNDDTTGPTTCN